MIKVDAQLLQILQDYIQFMDSEKTTNLPVVISEHKNNHPSSLYSNSIVYSSFSFGNTCLDCEIRNRDTYDYSFQIRSDRLKKQVVLRFDEGQAAHRNDIPGIPLDQQCVTTPHFHKYNSDGYLVAYKTLNLEKASQLPLSIEEGFDLFLNEANICDEGIDPRIQITKNGNILINLQQIDPLAEINF